MKKLLMMGSNFGSIEQIREAKKRGYHTIVTDYYDKDHSNAKRECDECWDYSTADTEAIAKRCIEEGVDGVSCGVSEYNSEMTFKVCDAAGLPKYCTWEGWDFTKDKRAFKEMCRKHGVSVAADHDISALDRGEEIPGLKLPVVVKPVDGAANVGVSFCRTKEDLAPALEYARSVTERKDDIICEQMLVGPEYAAMYALAGGEASLLSLFVMHNEEGTPPNIYCLDITTTGVLDRYLEQVDAGIKKVFRDGGYTDGLAWIELIDDERDGLLYVLEAGYRFPASMIPYTYKDIAGFDAVSWYLDGFMGIKHTADELPEPMTKEHERYGVSYLLWNSEGGKITSIEGMDIVAADERIDIVDNLRWPGYELKPNTLMAEVIFTADTREELIDTVRFVNETVSFRVEGDKDVLIRFTGFDRIV